MRCNKTALFVRLTQHIGKGVYHRNGFFRMIKEFLKEVAAGLIQQNIMPIRALLYFAAYGRETYSI